MSAFLSFGRRGTMIVYKARGNDTRNGFAIAEAIRGGLEDERSKLFHKGGHVSLCSAVGHAECGIRRAEEQGTQQERRFRQRA